MKYFKNFSNNTERANYFTNDYTEGALIIFTDATTPYDYRNTNAWYTWNGKHVSYAGPHTTLHEQ